MRKGFESYVHLRVSTREGTTMSNQLTMADIQAVKALLEQGWSQRRIARELGINRETVARYTRRWRESTAKPANLRLGSEASVEAKPAHLDPGSTPLVEAQDPLLGGLSGGNLAEASGTLPTGQVSACWAFREVIQSKLDQALSAQRIWQDLRAEHGF